MAKFNMYFDCADFFLKSAGLNSYALISAINDLIDVFCEENNIVINTYADIIEANDINELPS